VNKVPDAEEGVRRNGLPHDVDWWEGYEDGVQACREAVKQIRPCAGDPLLTYEFIRGWDTCLGLLRANLGVED
jgi:hypothetical protein